MRRFSLLYLDRLGRHLVGWLSLAPTRPGHSGNYSCVPSYATPDWVMVHVIPDQEEVPANLLVSEASPVQYSEPQPEQGGQSGLNKGLFLWCGWILLR